MKRKKIIILLSVIILCIISIIIAFLALNNSVNEKINKIIEKQEYVFEISEKTAFVASTKNKNYKKLKAGSALKDTYYIGNDFIIETEKNSKEPIPEQYNSKDKIAYSEKRIIYYFNKKIDIDELSEKLKTFAELKEQNQFGTVIEKNKEPYQVSYNMEEDLEKLLNNATSKQTSYIEGQTEITNFKEENK